MKIKTFEDLSIWQEARELCKYVFKVTSGDLFNRDLRFRSQIRSASGSVMDNIAEGFSRGGKKEFIHFLYIAKGSCSEIRSQSYRALDFQFISDIQHQEILAHTASISKQIFALINYLKETKHLGHEFR